LDLVWHLGNHVIVLCWTESGNLEAKQNKLKFDLILQYIQINQYERGISMKLEHLVSHIPVSCQIKFRPCHTSASHQLLTVDAKAQSQGNPCGICGGESGIVTGFPPRTLVFPANYHYATAPYSSVITIII